MNIFTRYTVVVMIFLALMSISTLTVSAKKSLSATYSISLIHPSTKQVTIALQGTESKKQKVLALCKGYLKTKKSYGIKCIWDSKTIYSKKSTPIKVSSGEKNTISSGVTPDLPKAETRVFDGYIDGRIVVTDKEATKLKATETCGLIMRANPESEITCRWGDIVLDTRLIIEATKAHQIELLKSTSLESTGSYLIRDKEQEIGRFSLKSGSGNTETRIESLTLTNIGSTRLRSIVDYETSARLIDIDSAKEVSATIAISDTSITLTKMDATLTGGTTRNYKILLSIHAMKDIPEYSTTISLTLDPQDIKIVKRSDASRIPMIGGVLAMKTYTIGKKPPTIGIANTGENTFRIKITNTDENYPLAITTLTLSSQLTLPSGKLYSGIACLRDSDVYQACGVNGSTVVSVPGQSREISLVGASLRSSIASTSSVEMDLYISSDSIFPTGGQVDITLESIGYIIDGKSFTERFPNTPTVRSSYKK